MVLILVLSLTVRIFPLTLMVLILVFSLMVLIFSQSDGADFFSLCSV